MDDPDVNYASHRFQKAMQELGNLLSTNYSAFELSKQLATNSGLSSLTIFRAVSKLTRGEALEVLAFLTFYGANGIPAAIRIASMLRTYSVAWESISKLLSETWCRRDLSILAVTFGKRARLARDWTETLNDALLGEDEARLIFAAISERREIKFDSEKLLCYGGMPIMDWSSQEDFEGSPSLGRELDWCSFAASLQLQLESNPKCSCVYLRKQHGNCRESTWLQEAETGSEKLNSHYFRMFSMLIPKRTTTNQIESAEFEHRGEVSFAVTPSVRQVFFEFVQLMWTGKPIILEGPHGCGKSAAVERLAHITATGRNIFCAGKANVCFVHMDSATNKNDGGEFSELIGSTVPLPNGGGFQWRHGPIGHAIERGSWLILENLDCDNSFGNPATSAFVSQLAALRPGDEFSIGTRVKPLRVGAGFRVIATRTVDLNEKQSSVRWNPPGGWGLWTRIDFPAISGTEQLDLLKERFSKVSDCVPRILRAVNDVSSILRKRGKSHDREPTFREAVNVCRRLDFLRRCSSVELTPEIGLSETLDVLVCWARDEASRNALSEACAAAWSLPADVSVAILKERSPSISEIGESIQIGRSVLGKRSNKKGSQSKGRLALTKHTSRVLERIAVSVSVGECVLLNGETGTGKTSTLQELARLADKKLIVVNMSRQSDIAELIGGFRPLEVAAVLPDLAQRFENVFCLRMSAKKNADFLDALHKSVRNPKHHGRALRLIIGAVSRVPASLRNSDNEIAKEWVRIEKMAERLKKLLPSGETRDQLLDENEQPPRKRRRSNEKPSDNSSRRISFHFVDGVLVRALREGHWILLDEINLAPVEVLDHIVSVLDHNSIIVPNESGEAVSGANGFCMFAAMNPPTDFGKRPLAKELRSRMTEFFIEDIEDEEDIRTLISHRLYSVDCSRKDSRILSNEEDAVAKDVARFYLACRNLSRIGGVQDSSGKCVRFSLRTLSNMLRFFVQIREYMVHSSDSHRRALFEGAMLAFITPLPRSSRHPVIKLAMEILLRSSGKIRDQKPLLECMRVPRNIHYDDIVGFPVEISATRSTHGAEQESNFIETSAVRKTLIDVCRMLTFGADRCPVLLQGPTSVGKTSIISYLAHLTGNKLIRINNHEHTDLAEYLGSYVATSTGSLIFQEGPLVQAVRNGYWVVLDELNLAPPEILESLNRLLDDNKEIRIPETGEVVRAHRGFTLFATQNPPGIYGGRKELSRAFLGRFIEIQVDELPDEDLQQIIERRCRLPKSFAKAMVGVMRKLEVRRRDSHLFLGKSGFVTARDLFRWGSRRPTSRLELAIHGFFLLAERARNAREREIVRDILTTTIGLKPADALSDALLYGTSSLSETVQLFDQKGAANGGSDDFKTKLLNCMAKEGIASTPHMMRTCTLLYHSVCNNEPVLLVGPTGTGKTSACDLISKLMDSTLRSVNCHRHIESSDFVGGFLPTLDQSGAKKEALFEWSDGPLVQAMVNGEGFLIDEINMADDAVIERLNAVLEPSRTLMLPERDAGSHAIVAHENFRIYATMNPGGDFGKKELSPALRNRFTEVWIPAPSSLADYLPVIRNYLPVTGIESVDTLIEQARMAVQNIVMWMKDEINEYELSLREISAWCSFISNANSTLSVHPLLGFAHGARLVFLDGISVGSSSKLRGICQIIWEKVLQEIPMKLKQDAFSAAFPNEISKPLVFSSDQQGIRVGMFSVKARSSSIPQRSHPICTTASCTIRNGGRLVRAMAVSDKPILLEGPPGAGKTSLISALAAILNVQLARMNLSDSTEMADLLGGHVPGCSSGFFDFRKGELLRAMEAGSWVLLDEMNLASQSVLEGLNSLLDHRRSVYVPELGREVVANPTFRLFAAQNPATEGSGRRGLPRSFLNRFVKVAIEPPSDKDLQVIASELYPSLDLTVIGNIVQVVSLLRKRFRGSDNGMEFGLRQVLRWCSLLDPQQKKDDFIVSVPNPELCFDVVICGALKQGDERNKAFEIFKSVFKPETSPPKNPAVRKVDSEHIRIGCKVLRTGTFRSLTSLGLSSELDLRVTDTSIMQFLAIATNQRWPCIVCTESSGTTDQTSSSIIERFAALNGQKILKVKGGSFQDVDDLLGGFVQREPESVLEQLRGEFFSLYQDILTSALTSTKSASRKDITAFQCLEQANVLLSNFAENSFFPWNKLDKIDESIRALNEFGCGAKLIQISNRLSQLLDMKANLDSGSRNCGFVWQKSLLVRAIERGDWIILEDANRCPAAVLDRLNPLLEVSKSKTRDQSYCEPVLLPEAPPNLDGTPAFMVPHSNFRMFFLYEDLSGKKLSRAIIDRSVSLRWNRLEGPNDVCSELARKGITDFDLRCLHSALSNEVKAAARVLEALDTCALGRSTCARDESLLLHAGYDSFTGLCARLSLSSEEVTRTYKHNLSSFVLQLFLLSSSTNTDLQHRLSLVSILEKSRDLLPWVNSNWCLPSSTSNRLDLCLDPVFGFDSFHFGKGDILNRSVLFRFDVLVLADLQFALAQLRNDDESRKLGRDSVYCTGRKNVTMYASTENQHLPASIRFCVLMFRIAMEISNSVNNFREKVSSVKDESAINIPSEECWVFLFMQFVRFIDFVRSSLSSNSVVSNGMVLLKIMDDVTQIILMNSRVGAFESVLGNVRALICRRPKYEILGSEVPLPVNDFAFQTERDLVVLSESSERSQIASELFIVPRALVSLTSKNAVLDRSFKGSMERILGILRGKANENKTQELSIKKCGLPLWDAFTVANAEHSSFEITKCLRSAWSSRSSFKDVSLTIRDSRDELRLNPSSNLLAKVLVQRCSWISEAQQLSKSQLWAYHKESQISLLKASCARLRLELDMREKSPGNRLLPYTLSIGCLLGFPDSPERTVRFDSMSAIALAMLTGYSSTHGRKQLLCSHANRILGALFDLKLMRTSGTAERFDSCLQTLLTATQNVHEGGSLDTLQIGHTLSNTINAFLSDEGSLQKHDMEPIVTKVTAILSIICGARRIERFADRIENLLGMDPSLLSSTETSCFATNAMNSIALETACHIYHAQKLGGDDLSSSHPIRTARVTAEYSEKQAISSQKRMNTRPSEGVKFSDFSLAVPNIKHLVGKKSALCKLLSLDTSENANGKHDVDLRNQLVSSCCEMLESTAKSLELGGEWSHFRDVTGELSLGVREVQFGVLEFIKSCMLQDLHMSSVLNPLCQLVSNLLLFPRAAFACEDSLLNILSKCESLKLQPAFHASILRYLSARRIVHTDIVKEILNWGFGVLVDNWKQKLLVDEDQEEIETSLFVIKERARADSIPALAELQSLEVDDEADFQRLFMSEGQEEVDNLMSYHEKEGEMGDESQSVKQEANEEKPSNIDILDPLTLWEYHRLCYLSKPLSRENILLEKNQSRIALFESLSHCQSFPNLSSHDCVVMSTLAACALSASSSTEKRNLKSPSSIDLYNFYKDPNLTQAYLMKLGLQSFIESTSKVQDAFFGNEGPHSALTLVREAATKALKAIEFSKCLGTLVSVLENVLRKVDEFTRLFATREMVAMFQDEVSELLRIAHSWRRLEVDTWPNLLNLRSQLARERALQWFYYLYDSLVLQSNHAFEVDVDSIISTIDQFLRSSPLGEFETRLSMLQSICCQLRESNLPTQCKIFKAVHGLCELYSLFLPKIAESLEHSSEPIEKKMKDFAKLTTYSEGASVLGSSMKEARIDKHLEYARLQSKSAKVRKKLHKLCREIDASLNVSSFDIVCKEITRKGFNDLLSERNPRTQAAGANCSRPLISTQKFGNLFVTWSSRPSTFLIDSSLLSPNSRLSKLEKLTGRMKELAQGKTTALVLNGSSYACTEFRTQVRTRACELRESKEAGIQLKQRAFIDLLRVLENAGVSPVENPAHRTKEKPTYWLGIPTPFGKNPQYKQANYYFYSAGNRLQRLRAVSDGRARNNDITAAESKKVVALVSDMFVRSCSERKSLGQTLQTLERTRYLASELSLFEETSLSPTIKSAKEMIDFVKRVSEIELDFKNALETAESEIQRGKAALKDKSVGKYGSTRIKRSLADSTKSIEMLRTGHSSLNKFVLAECVVLLLAKAEAEPLIMTTELSEALGHATQIAIELKKGLQTLLQSSEELHEFSFMSELLRPVVSLFNNLLPELDMKQTKHSSGCREVLLTKTEFVIDEVLRSAQEILVTTEVFDVLSPERQSNEILAEKMFVQATTLVERLSKVSGLIRLAGNLSELCILLESNCIDHVGVQAVRATGAFVNTYLEAVVCPFVQAASEYHVNSLALLKTLEALFIGISEEGYCRPAEEEEGPADENFPENVDGAGFGEIGDGDASLAQDVSAEVENEEQLLGIKGDAAEEPEKQNSEEKQTDPQSGFETQADFDGDLVDVDRPDEDGHKENDENSENGQEAETSFGDEPDVNAVEIDEKLWEPEEDSEERQNDESKANDGEMDSREQGSESTLKAREDSQSQPKAKPTNPGKEEAPDSLPSEEDKDENEEQEATGKDETDAPTGDKNFKAPDLPEENDDVSKGDEDLGDTDEMVSNELSKENSEDNNGDEAMVGNDFNESQLEEENPGSRIEEDTQDLKDEPKDEIIDGLAEMSVDDDESYPMDLDKADKEPQETDDVNASENCQIEGNEKETGTEPPDDEEEVETQTDSADVSRHSAADESVKGGQKTTEIGQEKDRGDTNSQAFSNPDGNSNSKSVADESNEANKSNSGDHGNAADPGFEPDAEANARDSNTAAPTGESSEYPDPISSEHDPNPFRKNVDSNLGKQWEQCVNILEEQIREQTENDTSEDDRKSSALHEFTEKDGGTVNKVALASASEEQHVPLPEEMAEDKNRESDDEDSIHLGRNSASEELKLHSTRETGNSVNQQQEESAKDVEMTDKPSEDITIGSHEDTAENIGEHPLISAMKVLENEPSHNNSAAANTSEEIQQQDTISKEENKMYLETKGIEISKASESEQFRALWRKLENMTAPDSAVLSEQLRLVLEPTVRSGLAGSFRSGKRLEMKKVIDFVASDFRRDRIWQRRIRPSKRSYDVLIAIDNSESMRENNTGPLGLAGLVLIMSALSKLEIGRVGLLKFGEGCQVVHNLSEAIHVSEAKGAEILSHFSFTDKETNVTELLDTADEILAEAHDTGADEDVQLLFVISDGRLSNREDVSRKLRHLNTRNVLVAFIIVNNGGTRDTDIFEAKRVVFLKNGELETLPYMSDYPFEFYTVVQDVRLLPNVLGNALRQWLELMASKS